MNTNINEKPECKCKGMLGPNAICGHVTVNSNRCSAPADAECEHKGGYDRGFQRNQNNEGDLVDNS